MQKLHFRNWKGLSEFNIPADTLTDITLSNKKRSKTEYDLYLENLALDIILSMQGFMRTFDVFQHDDDFKLRADELVQAYHEYYDEFHQDFVYAGGSNYYVDHLSVLYDLNRLQSELFSGKQTRLEDIYILAFILVNEALRLEGDESAIAASEATKVIGNAKFRFNIYSRAKQRADKVGAGRHENNRKVRDYAQDLALGYKNIHPSRTAHYITDQIKIDVKNFAEDELECTYTTKTIYGWVLKVIPKEDKCH